jgi:large subunit ribosomal protein L15
MELSVSTIRSPKGSRRSKKRLGRGNASGHGTYSTRGIKGQRARQGGRKGLTQFGAKHFVTRLPKVRGFQSFKPAVQVVTLASLARLANGKEVSPEVLCAERLIEHANGLVKAIGAGSLPGALILKVHRVSQGARAAIERAGGSVELLPLPDITRANKRKPTTR